MRAIARLMLCVAALVAAAVPGHTVVEGCTVQPDSVCEYGARNAGNIAAVGEWKVEVWWNGYCTDDLPDYTRSSAPHTAHPASPEGDNNVGGVAGTWEGTVAAGSCARVTTGNGIALVGGVVVTP